MGAYIGMALRNLAQARRRTLLLGTALGGVSMLLVVMMALTQGINDTLVQAATTLSSGHFNVAGFYKAKPSDSYPMVTKTPELRQLVRDKVPGVVRVVDRGRGWGKLISETGGLNVGLNGLRIEEEGPLLERLVILSGDARQLDQPNSVLIFEGQAERLEVKVGDQLTVTTENFDGKSNTGELRVVAIARDVGFMSNWSVFVNIQVINQIYSLADDVSGSVLVYLDDMRRIPAAMATARAELEKAGWALMDHQSDPFWVKFEVVQGEDWVGQKLDLTSWEDETSYMKPILSGIDSLTFFLIAILMVLIVVGIMNSMWIAVRERTQEIGTMRAIGMQRWQVVALFLTEALVLAVIAAGAGAVVGAGFSLGLDALRIPVNVDAIQALLMTDTLNLGVRLGQVVGPVVVFAVVTMAAALWPALKAARLQPVTAIHRVG